MPVAGALIGAAAGIGGALITSSASKSAANSAANAAAANNALQKDIYQKNTANETPFMARGNAAGGQINALLGLGGGTGGSPGSVDWGAYVNGNPDALANWNAIKNTSDGAQFGGDINAFGQYHYTGDGSRRDLSPYTSGAVSPTDASTAAQNAFSQFRNSDGYQFRLDQGLNAGNTNYALRGAQGSGAALKGLNDYAQGQASNEFSNYMGQLQNQQGVGLSAANALNGVGTNYANAVGSNNNNAAGAAGAAAITSGNAWSNALGGVAGAVQQVTGSSYGGGNGLNFQQPGQYQLPPIYAGGLSSTPLGSGNF